MRDEDTGFEDEDTGLTVTEEYLIDPEMVWGVAAGKNEYRIYLNENQTFILSAGAAHELTVVLISMEVRHWSLLKLILCSWWRRFWRCVSRIT